MNEQSFHHITVLKDQAVEMMNIQPGMTVLDCTAGGGGHTELVVQCLQGKGSIIAFDQDPNAREVLHKKFASEIDSGHLHVVPENFSQVKDVCDRMNLNRVDAILADIGVSSPQLDHADRGFSFRHDGPLDMRMDPEGMDETAADVVNTYPEKDLARIIFQLGEEPKSRFVAKEIVKRRTQKPFTTTAQLANCVEEAIHYKTKSKKHPATKTFQALRIYVNRELEVLKQLIDDGYDCLKVGGRLAIITFHSLEDRIVKKAFKSLCSEAPQLKELRGVPLTSEQINETIAAKIVKPFPQIPSEQEVDSNPRARSAKLRVIEKINEKK